MFGNKGSIEKAPARECATWNRDSCGRDDREGVLVYWRVLLGKLLMEEIIVFEEG